MGSFSAFDSYGLLEFSSQQSAALSIYESIVAGMRDGFDMSQGTPAEAEAYATAMALSTLRATQDRARNQHDPRRAFEMLPALERDFGVVPGETDSVDTRQRAVTARKQISRGPRAESIENALLDLLGDDFIAYRVFSVAESAAWPSAPASGPGVFGRDEIPIKLFRTTSAISVTGVESSFAYELLSSVDDGNRLDAGDVVCVQPENPNNAEKVEILAVSGLTATALFTRGHDAGSLVTTGPVPLWTSTKRHVLVVVSDAASVDTETRRRIDDLMTRISRGVTTWQIVKASSTTTVGPFTVEVSPLGSVPIGTLSIP